MTEQSKPEVYGFKPLTLIEQLLLIPGIGIVILMAIDYSKDVHTFYDTFFLLMLSAIVLAIYVVANLIYKTISTKYLLFDDHIIFKRGKHMVQMKYEHVKSIKMREGDAGIEDIYGNRIPFSGDYVRNVKELAVTLMKKTENANVPEDIYNIGISDYIYSCKSCKKEFFVKTPASKCPKCGAKKI